MLEDQSCEWSGNCGGYEQSRPSKPKVAEYPCGERVDDYHVRDGDHDLNRRAFWCGVYDEKDNFGYFYAHCYP